MFKLYAEFRSWMTESMERAKNPLFLIFTCSTHLYGFSLYLHFSFPPLQGITFKNQRRSIYLKEDRLYRMNRLFIDNFSLSLSFTHVRISSNRQQNLSFPFTNLSISIFHTRTEYNRALQELFPPLLFPYPILSLSLECFASRDKSMKRR